MPSGTKNLAGIWLGATQSEYNAGSSPSRVVTSELQPPATRLTGIIRISNLPISSLKASQAEFDNGTAVDKFVTPDLRVDVSRLKGDLTSLVGTPDTFTGNWRLRVTSANVAVNASKLSPSIVNISSIALDGKVTLGIGTQLPALAISNIPVFGGDTHYVYVSGALMGIRLHAPGNMNTYGAGDKIFLLDDFTGFSKISGKQIGIVISGNSASGIYNVVLNLWIQFLGIVSSIDSYYRPNTG